MVEKIQIEDIEITFALRGISPVSRNSLIRLPNNLFWTTKLYSLSDDLTKKLAARISQIVPGSPGTKYPIMPNVRNIRPNEIKMNFFSLASSLMPPVVRFYSTNQIYGPHSIKFKSKDRGSTYLAGLQFWSPRGGVSVCWCSQVH